MAGKNRQKCAKIRKKVGEKPQKYPFFLSDVRQTERIAEFGQ